MRGGINMTKKGYRDDTHMHCPVCDGVRLEFPLGEMSVKCLDCNKVVFGGGVKVHVPKKERRWTLFRVPKKEVME
jgi:hypothetical protein